MAAKHILEVTEKVQLTENVYLLTFRIPDTDDIPFTAGQNMMLMIGPGINRTMSIASPPSLRPLLHMVHDVSPMGPGSKWTLGLSKGDTATIVAPTGGALSLVDSTKRKVMIATGTGIAPFHSMILDRLGRDPKTPLVLYWGLRHEEDVYWKDEFDGIATLNPSFMWHLILSQPHEGWQGDRGHVTEHVLKQEKDMSASEFYLCGNKAMIEEMKTNLEERGIAKEQIKTELFF